MQKFGGGAHCTCGLSQYENTVVERKNLVNNAFISITSSQNVIDLHR